MPHGAFFHRGPAEVKRLLIEALQEHFADHPLYSDPDGPGVLIRNKFAKSERHKRQVVITTASASPQRLSLSADFGGRVISTVALGKLEGQMGGAIEWVVENPLQKIRPRPGIYLVEMDTASTFTVSPFYSVRHEILYPFVDRDDGDKVKIALRNSQVEPASEFLMLDEHLPLERGKDYVIDYDSGVITLTGAILDARMIAAEYRWLGETSEPFQACRQTYDVAAMPGIILNFGRKTRVGSRQAVVVLEKPEHIADFWTGRWTVSVNADIYTQDTIEQDEMAAEVAQVFWYWNTERWADQGMSLVEPPDISGGTDEMEDEIADEYHHANSISLTVVVDWEAFVPCFRKVKTVNTVGYGISPFDPPVTSVKKDLDARPDGQFGNILDRNTLPGKGVQVVQDLRRYFSGPDDPKLGQLYNELLAFDASRASDALSQYYGSVDPANPDAPDMPINLPERVPVSEFNDPPDTLAGVPMEPGVTSKTELLSFDELPCELREELRRISRGSKP